MKNKLFVLFVSLFIVAGAQAQKSFFVTNGVTHQSRNSASWVGETAVFNSDDGGSFQVLFKTVPTKSKTYKVRDNASFSYDGKETEASVAMLENDFNDYSGSVLPNKGKITVKVKKGVITIIVKNVQMCSSDNSVCKPVSGQIVIGN